MEKNLSPNDKNLFPKTVRRPGYNVTVSKNAAEMMECKYTNTTQKPNTNTNTLGQLCYCASWKNKYMPCTIIRDNFMHPVT